MTEEQKKTTSDALTRIYQVCRSPYFSKDAKLAYVMLAAPEADGAITCYCDPPEDVKNGLHELARKGLISLRINNHEFGAQIISHPLIY
jgi:hypothetical protein